MGLGFRCARSDGCPAHEIGRVLGDYGIQEFRCCRESEVEDIEKQFAGKGQAECHVTRVIETGIVDEALPADRRAGFLKIDAHHNKEAVFEFAAEGSESFRIFHCRCRIVDRARADDDKESVVFTANDSAGFLAGLCYETKLFGIGGKLLLDLRRGDQPCDTGYADVFDGHGVGGWIGFRGYHFQKGEKHHANPLSMQTNVGEIYARHNSRQRLALGGHLRDS